MGMRTVSAVVAAPLPDVWTVLADFGAIAAWAPQVVHSRLLTTGPVGLGTVRRVQLGRQTLRETVASWEPPHRLGYRLTGLPPRLGDVTTTWELTEAPDGGTRVTVCSELRPSVPPPVATLVLVRLKRAAEELLAGLACAAETKTAETKAAEPKAVG